MCISCRSQSTDSAINTQALPGLSDSFTQQHSANIAKQWYACIVQEIQNIIVSCGQEIQKSRLRFLLIHRLKRNLNTKDCVSHTSGVRLPPFFSASSSPFNSAHTSFLSCLQQEQTGKCNLYSRDCVSKMFINSILFMYLSIWAQYICGNLLQLRISFVPQSQALPAIMAVTSVAASDLNSLLLDVHRLQECLPPSPRNAQTRIDRQDVSILVSKQGQCSRSLSFTSDIH